MKFAGNTRISKGGTLLTGSEASPTVEPTGSSLMLALNKIYFIDLFYKETRTKISTKYTDIKRKGALILQELLQRESLTKQKSISTFFFTCSHPPPPKKHLGITCSRKCKCRSPHLTWPRTHPPATRTEGAQGWTRSWAGSGAGGGQWQLAQDQGQGPG